MLNIPNSLTLLRILLVPVFVILVSYGRMDTALIILVIAAITDGLDGLIARVFAQKTMLGSYLDPVADKILIITAYISLTIVGRLVPPWLTITVISRDVVILTGFMILFFLIKDKDTLKVRPSLISKVTTLLQLLTIVLVLFYSGNSARHISILFIATAIFTIVSGLDYIYKGLKLVEI